MNDLLTVFPLPWKSLVNHDIVHIIIFSSTDLQKHSSDLPVIRQDTSSPRIVWKSWYHPENISSSPNSSGSSGSVFCYLWWCMHLPSPSSALSEILTFRYFQVPLLRKFWIHLQGSPGETSKRISILPKSSSASAPLQKICFRHILFCHFCCFKSDRFRTGNQSKISKVFLSNIRHHSFWHSFSSSAALLWQPD